MLVGECLRGRLPASLPPICQSDKYVSNVHPAGVLPIVEKVIEKMSVLSIIPHN